MEEENKKEETSEEPKEPEKEDTSEAPETQEDKSVEAPKENTSGETIVPSEDNSNDTTEKTTKKDDDNKTDDNSKNNEIAVTDKTDTEKIKKESSTETPVQKTPTKEDPKPNRTGMFIIIGLVVLLAIFGVTQMTGNTVKSETGGNSVLFETSMGDVTIKLYNDMPITTENFKSLVEKGTYDGVIFHRVIDGFMIQGGDPTGTGFGDPNIPNIQDEFTHAGGNKNSRGTISMANSGPNTGSSQFFINLIDNDSLDDKHPAFGEVTQGMDIVDKIAKVSKDAQDRPLEDVVIIKASII